MSTTPSKTAAATVAKNIFPGHARAAIELFDRTNKRRHMAPANIFTERTPVVATDRILAPVASQPKPFLPSHLGGTMRGFRSVEQAENATLEFLAGLAELQGNPDRELNLRLRERGLKPLAIANTDSPAAGGYLERVELASAIWENMGYGAARQLANVVPVESGAATVPVQGTMPTVYRPAELATVTASDITWGSIGVNIGKRATIVKISSELNQDNAVGIIDGYVAQTSMALSGSEDEDFISGDGTATYSGVRGLLNAVGTAGIHTPSNGTGKSVWSGLTLTEFAATMGKLPARYFGRAKWLVHPLFYATAMVPNSAAIGVSPSGKPSFLGYEVVLSSKMTAASAVSTISAFFGDFASGVVLANRSLTFMASDKAPGLIENDLLALRTVSRVDIICHNVGDSSTAGAVVALKTAAS